LNYTPFATLKSGIYPYFKERITFNIDVLALGGIALALKPFQPPKATSVALVVY
jgi:hypothetical protein